MSEVLDNAIVLKDNLFRKLRGLIVSTAPAEAGGDDDVAIHCERPP